MLRRSSTSAGLVDVTVLAPGFKSDDGVFFGPHEAAGQQPEMSIHPSFLLPVKQSAKAAGQKRKAGGDT